MATDTGDIRYELMVQLFSEAQRNGGICSTYGALWMKVA